MPGVRPQEESAKSLKRKRQELEGYNDDMQPEVKRHKDKTQAFYVRANNLSKTEVKATSNHDPHTAEKVKQQQEEYGIDKQSPIAGGMAGR